jgi:hypothetical protein
MSHQSIHNSQRILPKISPFPPLQFLSRDFLSPESDSNSSQKVKIKPKCQKYEQEFLNKKEHFFGENEAENFGAEIGKPCFMDDNLTVDTSGSESQEKNFVEMTNLEMDSLQNLQGSFENYEEKNLSLNFSNFESEGSSKSKESMLIKQKDLEGGIEKVNSSDFFEDNFTQNQEFSLDRGFAKTENGDYEFQQVKNFEQNFEEIGFFGNFQKENLQREKSEEIKSKKIQKRERRKKAKAGETRSGAPIRRSRRLKRKYKNAKKFGDFLKFEEMGF